VIGGLRAVPLACLLLAACNTAPPQQVTAETKEKVENAEADCTARAAVDALRDQVFDAAIAKVEGNEATKLNSLRSVIQGRLENPLVQAHDPALKRTQCAGRLVFGLPPNTQKAFEGATQLIAEVNFSAQPAADGSGLVVEANGYETIVDQLIAGAQKKRTVRVPVPGEPKLRTDFTNMFEADDRPSEAIRELSDPLPSPDATAKPSFSCKGDRNKVERMICDDAGLAYQDQTMASAYRDARERTPADRRAGLEAVRNKYLGQRNRCTDAACIGTTYDAWTSAMYDWNP
jgi:hypothetical protein